MEHLVEKELPGETEVLGENLPQFHFVHHEPTRLDLRSNPCRRGWKLAANRLGYGTALLWPNETVKWGKTIVVAGHEGLQGCEVEVPTFSR
jgi:hypothetical protein